MGVNHNWTSKGKYLTQDEADDVKKLIKAAEQEFDVKLYEDYDYKPSVSPFGRPKLTGYGEPTVHTARISFAVEGQGNVNMFFGPGREESDFTQTQAESVELSHEADMLTGSIMLYLASRDKIDYFAGGISSAAPHSDNPEDSMYLYVDQDIVDSFAFGEHVLGKGAMGDLKEIAQKQEGEWVSEWSGIFWDIPETSLAYGEAANKPSAVPLTSRQSQWSAGSSEAGRCGAWMPRANESCVLTLAHAGPHRSR